MKSKTKTRNLFQNLKERLASLTSNEFWTG